MNINIKAKLKAYTKGIIPVNISQLVNDLDFISDAPKDTNVYARKDGEWVNVNDGLTQTIVEVAENSGLHLDVDANKYILRIKKYDIKKTELPTILEPDTTYYVSDLTANVFADGGTVFSTGNNEYVDESQVTDVMNGGTASTQPNRFIYVTNSQGVYNG